MNKIIPDLINKKTNEMNFPLQYNLLCKYFDLDLNGDSVKRNHMIEKILNEFNVNFVLDFTCGTGSQSIFLYQNGFKVVGVDLMPELIEIAKSKCDEIKFIHGDIRESIIGKFDAVISIHNAIGHLTKNEFEKSIDNICSQLNNGGIYIFDIFNLKSMSEKVINELAMDNIVKFDDGYFHNTQYSEIHGDILTSYDVFTIKKNDQIDVFKGNFSLQIYSIDDVKKILQNYGFGIVEIYDFNSFDQLKIANDSTLSVLYVAKKTLV